MWTTQLVLAVGKLLHVLCVGIAVAMNVVLVVFKTLVEATVAAFVEYLLLSVHVIGKIVITILIVAAHEVDITLLLIGCTSTRVRAAIHKLVAAILPMSVLKLRCG